MGTSVSFRSPHTVRWLAFTAALQQQMPMERIRSELFNAGNKWEEALAGPAVAAFAQAASEAIEDLSARFEAGGSPERTLAGFLSEANTRAQQAQATPAAAIASRALASVLIRSIGSEAPLSEQTAEQAAAHLREAFAGREHATSSYLGEVLSQYARHITAREAGFLSEGPEAIGAAEARERTRQLADLAREVGSSVDVQADWTPSDWSSFVRSAFAHGRRLPDPDT